MRTKLVHSRVPLVDLGTAGRTAVRYGRTVLNSDLRIAIPTVRLFGPYGFSVTAGTGTCSKLFNKQTKK